LGVGGRAREGDGGGVRPVRKDMDRERGLRGFLGVFVTPLEVEGPDLGYRYVQAEYDAER
jgi:hypothetical protein